MLEWEEGGLVDVFVRRRELTSQYGYLKFDDNALDSTTRLSQYMRLALQTSAETAVEFLRSGWQLPTPDLIISVTGGGRQCKISAHLRKTFQRGLVAAAAATSETSTHSLMSIFVALDRCMVDHLGHEYGHRQRSGPSAQQLSLQKSQARSRGAVHWHRQLAMHGWS